jgi:hypothetical protein
MASPPPLSIFSLRISRPLAMLTTLAGNQPVCEAKQTILPWSRRQSTRSRLPGSHPQEDATAEIRTPHPNDISQP